MVDTSKARRDAVADVAGEMATAKRDPSRNEVDEACMNYRHDFGLMSIAEANALRLEALYWLQAWKKVNMAQREDQS